MIIGNDPLVSKHGLHSKSKFLPVRKWFATPVNDGKTFSLTKRFPAWERGWFSQGGAQLGVTAKEQGSGDGVGPSGLHRTLTVAGRRDNTVGEQVPRVDKL